MWLFSLVYRRMWDEITFPDTPMRHPLPMMCAMLVLQSTTYGQNHENERLIYYILWFIGYVPRNVPRETIPYQSQIEPVGDDAHIVPSIGRMISVPTIRTDPICLPLEGKGDRRTAVDEVDAERGHSATPKSVEILRHSRKTRKIRRMQSAPTVLLQARMAPVGDGSPVP